MKNILMLLFVTMLSGCGVDSYQSLSINVGTNHNEYLLTADADIKSFKKIQEIEVKVEEKKEEKQKKEDAENSWF